uniref:ELMO domain-containing protein n=1 Tax=Buteo japonicus TaxID=224669 RepID=A0A8B9ZBB0_9AVES
MKGMSEYLEPFSLRLLICPSSTGEMLAHTLKAFMELMEHDFVSWETLSAAFIKKIVSYVNMNAVDASVQQLSLSILENMVPTSRLLFELVKKEVTLDRLLTHLQQDLLGFGCHWALGLEELGAAAWGNLLTRSLLLNLCERRMRTSMDPYSQEQRELLQSLRQTAFESESEAPGSNFSTERRRSLCAKEFRKLGFMNNSNPAEDLRRAPPGLLALDNMVYFSRHTPNAYSRVSCTLESRVCVCSSLSTSVPCCLPAGRSGDKLPGQGAAYVGPPGSGVADNRGRGGRARKCPGSPGH